ncbi:MAG: glycosyl hydrolase, partial [Bacteroidetes bacterium]|nr:glycosyl hydrolase [Bacteroidota bacterium]
IKTFFNFRTYPFNSEIGSVGINDYESFKHFMPEENRIVPQERNGQEDVSDSVWNYHKYISYGNSISPYGKPTDLKDFAWKAQLVNYDQYRSLIEGFTSHMWEWYTGVIIWKTQNPWTAMRGQMYDYYLDPNACLYGLHTAGEPLHIFFNAGDSSVMVANNTFETHRDMMLQVKLFDMSGKEKLVTQVFSEVGPTDAKKYLFLNRELRHAAKQEGAFLVLRLLDLNQKPISDNLYWLADSTGNYSGLQHMSASRLHIKAKELQKGKIEVTLSNEANAPVAFFNRLSLVDPKTHERLLPVFYSDNYVSVLPGEEKKVIIDYTPSGNVIPLIDVQGWNFVQQQFKIE